MERSDNSDMTIGSNICCSLLMLVLGLFFCFPLAMLTYFTYQTITGSRQFCTLWIDVPGRIAILLICYYIASICRILPLPRRYHLHSFIVPFNVWRLRSWRRLFRNLCFRIPSSSLMTRLRRNITSSQEHLETPLLQENNQERLYTCSPRRRHTTPINIPYPEKYSPSVFISNPETTPRNETLGIIKSSNGSITSIDSSVGDIVLPIMPEKSSKRRYISVSTELPEDRDRVPSKYRKRFTETKWLGEAAGNALAPHSVYQVTRERREILTSDKKSKALTDDERLAISRRRRLGSELTEVHIKKDIELVLDTKTLVNDPSVPNKRPLDFDKYFELSDEEKIVTTRQEELGMSGKKETKVDTTDDELKVLAKNELLLEMNGQYRVHKRNLHLEGAACSNNSEALPKFCNTEAQMNFSGTRNGSNLPQELATDSLVVKERPLDDKYFEVTDNENFITSRPKVLQISVNERPEIHITADRLQLLARNEMPPKTNDQPTVHKRNLYPEGASCSNQQGAPSQYINTEAQLKFPRAHNRNQQSREATVSKKQKIPFKLHSTEAQMNFPRILVRNQQHGKETSSSERERVMRIRNYKTSLNFPIFPWLILRNSKGVSVRARELRKKHLESVNCERGENPEMGNRKQICLNRSLARCMLRSLRSQSVIQTQLPRSHRNINIVARSSENSPGSAKSSDKRIEVQPNTSSAASEGNVDLAINQNGAAQKQGRLRMGFSHAMNLNRSLVGRVTRRRRRLPSLRYHVYARTCSQIRDKTEVKKSVEHEKYRASDQKDFDGPASSVILRSNLSNFEEDSKRTGRGTPVTQETANENLNRSQLDDLRERLTLLKQNRTHLNIEASAAVESEESIFTKTTVKNDKDIGESNVSTKLSEAEAAKKPFVKIIIDSPLITSESDSDSDPGQSK